MGDKRPGSGPCGLCAKHTERSCGGCQSVFYCCQQHQSDDWKRHRSNCKYYKVVREPNIPSYLVATRRIPKGAVILKSKPLVVGPDGSKPVCLGCLRSLVYDVMSYLCEGCGWPVCGIDCQNAPMHELECKAMRKAGFRFDEMGLRLDWRHEFFHRIGLWILVLRVLLTNQSEKLLEMYSRENRAVSKTTLPDYVTEGYLNYGVVFIRDTLKLQQFEPDIIRNVTKVLLISIIPFKTLHGSLEPRHGFGVHASDLVNIEHSCYPNLDIVVTVEEPSVAFVVALEDIFSGEKLTASKNSSSMILATVERQTQQISMFRPLCCCRRCMDPSELGLHTGSLSCRKCGAMVTPINTRDIFNTDWVCDKCWSISKKGEVLRTWKGLRAELFADKQNNLAHLVSFIKTHSGPGGILHTKHQFISLAKEMYCNSIFNASREKGAAYRFDKKALALFYTYSEDLMSLNSDLHQKSSLQYVRLKLVHSWSTVHQWVEKTLSKKEAEARLKAVYLDAAEKNLLERKPMPSDMHLWFKNLFHEIDMLLVRLATKL